MFALLASVRNLLQNPSETPILNTLCMLLHYPEKLKIQIFCRYTATNLPKVIWEQGRVAAAVPGAGWHKGLRIRNICIVFVKDRCANVRYFSVRKQE